MRSIPVISAVLALLLATPSLAEWRTVQSPGKARAVYKSGNYELWIHCRRGQPLELWLMDLDHGGRDFQRVRSLMMWIKLPDGRTDRWPVAPVFLEDSGLSGQLVVSNFNLDFFRNAQSFKLDSPGSRQTFLAGDMKGTGAARLAFLEQCGI